MSEQDKQQIEEVVLTDKMKEALKTSIGFSVKDNFKYVPKDYRKTESNGDWVIPKSLWPIFIMKSKDGIESAMLEDESGYMTLDSESNKGKLHLQSGKRRISDLEKGIIEIKNFIIEENGEFIILNYHSRRRQAVFSLPDKNKREKNMTIKDCLRFLTTDLQVELQNAINERKTLTQEELMGLES